MKFIFIILFIFTTVFSYDILKDRVSRKIHHEEKKQKKIDSYKILTLKWKLTPKDLNKPKRKYFCKYEIKIINNNYYLHNSFNNNKINKILKRIEFPKKYYICFYNINAKIILKKKLYFKKNRKNDLIFYSKGAFYIDWFEAKLFEYAKINKTIMKENFKDI